jgi:Domain of unknown function (DUF4331)
MSHHLDSPIARLDPRLDICDLFLFRGERGTVFVTDHSHSLGGEDIPRGFHPEGMYEFKIDANRDAIEDLTYRFTFGERDARRAQSYQLRRLAGPEAREASAAGTVIASGRTDEIVEINGGGRVWAGKAGDSFWIEPDSLKAVGKAFHEGTAIDLSGWDPSRAKNHFAGHTVYSVVLEIPDEELPPVAGRDRTIGAWALASLRTDAGGWQPINRAGLPMSIRSSRSSTRSSATASTPTSPPTTWRSTATRSPAWWPAWCAPMAPRRTRRRTRGQ